MALNRPEGSIDVVARLLATENITLVRANVSTASFDIKNRVLTLPTWKNMVESEELMLVLHETAHALFTLHKEYAPIFETMRHLKGYANVLEDVRIEKLMKERYPGSRKQFSDGYRSLNDRDFFGVKNQDLDNLLLIDKINLYFKVGRLCGVKFDRAEEQFLMRAERTNTIPEVIQLASDIYEYSKNKKNAEEETLQQLRSEDDLELGENEGDGEGEGEYDDEFEYELNDAFGEGEDSDDEEDDEESVAGKSSQQNDDEEDEQNDLDEELDPTTDRAYQAQLEQMADTNLIMDYYEPVAADQRLMDRVFVSFKECIEDLVTQREGCKPMPAKSVSIKKFVEGDKKKIEQFKHSNNPFINYLVKEFEMRKSASAYKRAKIAKLGQLDMKKIYAYKLKDDLFRQIMTAPEGKNHGMIFLLDWSGSMSTNMHNTIEQVLALASFCQRIQIPYQVLAFTDGYIRMKERDTIDKYNFPVVEDNQSTNAKKVRVGHFNLLEIFSHKMKQSEFNFMQEMLLSGIYSGYSHIKYWGLSGTPLNESLLYMIDHVGEFKRQHNVEKLSFITLTDGEGGRLCGSKGSIRNGREYNSSITIRSVMRDPMTGLQYRFSDNSAQQTITFLEIIKDRYNCNMVGFFVTHGASTREVSRFLTHNSYNKHNYKAELLVADLRRERAAVLKNFAGRDEMYIISGKEKVEDGTINVNDKMTSNQLSKALFKSMNTKKHSRVVLDRFLNLVC